MTEAGARKDAAPLRRAGASLARRCSTSAGDIRLTSPSSSAVAQGRETHTRTGFMNLRVPPCEPGTQSQPETVRVPLTHVKVFGWYDNEMGSYTYRLGELTIRAARSM